MENRAFAMDIDWAFKQLRAEKDQALQQKDEAIQRKDETIQQKDETIQRMILNLREKGMSEEEIAKLLENK